MTTEVTAKTEACEGCRYFPKNCDLLIQDHTYGDGSHRPCEFSKQRKSARTVWEVRETELTISRCSKEYCKIPYSLNEKIHAQCTCGKLAHAKKNPPTSARFAYFECTFCGARFKVPRPDGPIQHRTEGRK